jgi:hypothetical protein
MKGGNLTIACAGERRGGRGVKESMDEIMGSGDNGVSGEVEWHGDDMREKPGECVHDALGRISSIQM